MVVIFFALGLESSVPRVIRVNIPVTTAARIIAPAVIHAALIPTGVLLLISAHSVPPNAVITGPPGYPLGLLIPDYV